MFSGLPAFISMPLSFLLFCLNLAFAGTFLLLGGLIKLLLPFKLIHQAVYKPMHFIYRFWALNNFIIMSLFNKIKWTITGNENLSKDAWYLLIANHQSWLDIFVLSNFARTHIPEPKYFLKDSLKKVPFIGMGCWALDMPFMKRYSKSYLKKHPHLIGTDIETTKRSCLKFKNTPTTIINFVEGTRFTPQKHQAQQNSFKHLLSPKAGGIAFTLATMGEQFDKILNITLVYPHNKGHIMKEMLKGQLKEVIIDIEQIDNVDKLLGNYQEDIQYKKAFHQWLTQLWVKNDKKITHYLSK
ncbi:acyltransferase [Colwellia sp. 1_MG-2023]|uniref:acyltransferase n=1 Tax=Colwellia sp. 1_MG-2023 TaxID=3062649 RepID=UPI0026E2A575|nr:acyltransferase [Colwellia sp. 1_MG-2023]MDO6446191.1 acyltransferase [Colwellia sp. 1_MG-2023]